MRYQGDQAGEFEAELRWQFHPRMSLVGFGGSGVARGGPGQRDREQTAGGYGAGFRYLLAREYGLHMGLDVAQGPDGPVLYVVFGNAWIRP
jgi:hemolysin activation/secretion protein